MASSGSASDGEMILTGLRDARFRPLAGRPALAGPAEPR